MFNFGIYWQYFIPWVFLIFLLHWSAQHSWTNDEHSQGPCSTWSTLDVYLVIKHWHSCSGQSFFSYVCKDTFAGAFRPMGDWAFIFAFTSVALAACLVFMVPLEKSLGPVSVGLSVVQELQLSKWQNSFSKGANGNSSRIIAFQRN